MNRLKKFNMRHQIQSASTKMWFRSGSERNVQYLRTNSILCENGQILFQYVLGPGYLRANFEISDWKKMARNMLLEDQFRLDFSRISTKNQALNWALIADISDGCFTIVAHHLCYIVVVLRRL